MDHPESPNVNCVKVLTNSKIMTQLTLSQMRGQAKLKKLDWFLIASALGKTNINDIILRILYLILSHKRVYVLFLVSSSKILHAKFRERI
ncbi:hypothetical protein CH365_15255 [Leptospira neocaledonica]|uniref:Uncharacterized protein n=1 Tax=Leptospira neocaledonica TaxID=2023192 RepID=A0A2M9ZVT3_9LEPT|nr:hypothetical protein CH365_15255 [Leptospira neocaledonica]